MGNSRSCCKADDTPPEVQEVCAGRGAHDIPDLPTDMPSYARSGAASDGGSCDLVCGEDTGRASRSTRGSERLENFVLEKDLLRGIPLRASLRNLGKLWVNSPIDLQEPVKASLWTRSHKVSKLDIFLSHTWHTPGWRKVIALLVQLGSYNFLLGWLLGMVLGATLHATLEIPYFIAPKPAMWMGALLGSVCGLLSTPYMPAWATFRGEPEKMCFFDAVCINQADPDMMQKGIYGLGGFLAAATELRILWSPPYLSRLWCVFEMAAFHKANPSGRIVLKPLFVESGLLCVVLGIYILIIVDEWRFNARSGVSQVVVALTMLPSYLLFHVLRGTLNDKHHLVNELRNFDISEVHCRTVEDRDCILAAISSWYGSSSSFAQHVRGPLADELTQHFSSTDLPGAYWLMIATPFITFNVAKFLEECQSPTSTMEVIVSTFLVRCVANSVLCVHYIQLVYFVCHRFAAPAGRLLDYGKTLLIWVLLAGALMCIFGLSALALRQPVAPAVAYSAAAGIVSCVVASRRRWRAWICSTSPCGDRSEPNSGP